MTKIENEDCTFHPVISKYFFYIYSKAELLKSGDDVHDRLYQQVFFLYLGKK